MSRSTTAVLLSALVLPGAGHFYLKHHPRGIALIAANLVCVWVIIDSAIRQASHVLDQLDIEGGALDAGHISALVTQTSSGSRDTVATLVLAGCWLVGMVDAYRLGYKSK